MFAQIPNLLTSIRILAALIPLAIFGSSTKTAATTALFILAIAIITDFLDGKLARAWNITSRLGQVMDSIADKMILTSLALLAINHGLLGPIGSAVVLLLILREIWISGIREGLGQNSKILSATKIAKWKTALQFLGLILLFLSAEIDLASGWVTELALLPALALSLASAWTYSCRGLAVLSREDHSK